MSTDELADQPATAFFGKLGDRIISLRNEGAEYDRVAMADTTLRTYSIMWRAFQKWCGEHEVMPLPASPEVVSIYVVDLARRLKASSIHVHLAAIGYYHEEAGYPCPNTNPIVLRRMSGIRRAKGMAPTRKRPFLLDDLDRALDLLGNNLRAARNRAMLMVTWSAALRRSEACGLDVGPGQGGRGFVTFTAQGMQISVTRNKTDQEGHGRIIAIPLRKAKRDKCPVRLLRTWLEVSGITEGPIFRPIDCNGNILDARLAPVSLSRAVKTAAKRLGFDRAAFGGHSLRAGLCTSTVMAGAPIASVQETTGHKQVNTLFWYVRLNSAYSSSPLKSIPSW